MTSQHCKLSTHHCQSCFRWPSHWLYCALLPACWLPCSVFALCWRLCSCWSGCFGSLSRAGLPCSQRNCIVGWLVQMWHCVHQQVKEVLHVRLVRKVPAARDSSNQCQAQKCSVTLPGMASLPPSVQSGSSRRVTDPTSRSKNIFM